jgi:hypothetical protein
MNRSFFGGTVVSMAIGFFAIFMAVHASIAGDSGSFILLMLCGVGAVSTGMAFWKWGRSIDAIRRQQSRTDEIRGLYDDPDDVHPDADAVIDPEILYPLWQKCNVCGVYLWEHGLEDHPWEEWAGGPDGHHTKGIEWDHNPTNSYGWDLGPGRILELTDVGDRVEDWRNGYDNLYPDDDDVVELHTWGEEKPVRRWSAKETREYQRQVERNRARKRQCVEHFVPNAPILGCTCVTCQRVRYGKR